MRYLLAALCFTCLAAAPALAHRRHFIETYESYLPAAGEWEIEAHTGVGLHPRVGYTDFHNEMEIENGTTAKWSNAVYFVTDQTHGEDLRFAGYKYETEYRLAEPNRLPLDPTLYLEYDHATGPGEPAELEGRVILGKNFGDQHFAADYVHEHALRNGAPAEHGYAIGWAHDTNYGTLGVEAYGNFYDRTHQIEPVVAVPVGHNWGLIGLSFPLNGRSQPLMLRTLLEIDL